MKTRRPKSSPPGKSHAKPAARPADKAGTRNAVHVAGALNASRGPFSRPIEVALAEDKPLRMTIAATEAECAEIARLNDIPAISDLTATFEVTSAGRERFLVSGEVRARVTQICVVSLEPFVSEIVQPVDVPFASPSEVEQAEVAYARRHEEDPDADNIPDPPDPIFNGQIDLGELACEELTLGLDPYPRKEGVEFVPETDEADGVGQDSPFAALAKLKQGQGEA